MTPEERIAKACYVLNFLNCWTMVAWGRGYACVSTGAGPQWVPAKVIKLCLTVPATSAASSDLWKLSGYRSLQRQPYSGFYSQHLSVKQGDNCLKIFLICGAKATCWKLMGLVWWMISRFGTMGLKDHADYCVFWFLHVGWYILFILIPNACHSN